MNLSTWIWRAFFRTALIPLLLVEVVLVGAYFLTNEIIRDKNIESVSQIAQERLLNTAKLHSELISHQLRDVAHTTDLFRLETARALTTPHTPATPRAMTSSPDGAWHTSRDTGGSAIFYSGFVTVGDKEREKALRLTQLDPFMKGIVATHDIVTQAYFNSFDSLNIIIPYFDVINQYTPKMNIPSFNFYFKADAKHNPRRESVWTKVYIDPAGQGWMLSSIAPVYGKGDFLEGVVGLDITVSTITQRVLNISLPWKGYGMLLDQDGVIMALPPAGEKDWGLDELTHHQYAQAILQDTFKPNRFNLNKRPDAGSLAQAMKIQPHGINRLSLGGTTKLAAWSQIPETGWRLLLLAPESEVNARADTLGEQVKHIAWLMIAGMIAFYAIYFMMLYQRARRMSRTLSEPLLEINHIAHGFSKGKYDQHPPTFEVTELTETSHHVVQMGWDMKQEILARRAAEKRLESARMKLELRVTERTAELLSSNERLLQEIQERKKIEEDLRTAKQIADSASRAKSDFLSSMSHEIRTPLNVVMGMGQLLKDTPLSIQQKSHLEKLNTFSRMLLGLLNNILDFSKIEAGKMALEHIPFSLGQIIETQKILAETRARGKKLQVSFIVESEVPDLLIGDPMRLEQVLTNLLSNAIKFTDQGAVTVRIAIVHHAPNFAWLRFTIWDTGIGISAEQQATLFQMFQQADMSTTRKYGGAGLGLAICRQLVGMMGGGLQVESEKGSGSSFSFTASFSLPDETQRRAFLETMAVNPHGPTSQPNLAPHSYQEKLEEIRGARILLVEDHEVNRELAREMLIKSGCFVGCVGNGQEAVDVLEHPEHDFDLVFMDMQMPVMDGLEATRTIRRYPHNDSLPIVAMTAHALEEDRRKSLEAGLNDHLTKPVDLNALHRMLYTWIPQNAPHREKGVNKHPDVTINSDTTTVQPPPSPIAVPGIDMADVMERLQGDQALFEEILTSFRRRHREGITDIRNLIDTQEHEQAARATHKLKGAASNLSANRIKRSAQQLEERLLTPYNHRPMEPLLSELEQALDELLNTP
ncbi:MAG: response regulator [Magnetococcales bacterium]|nr:response regulator [Magnetococcales bacterium]